MRSAVLKIIRNIKETFLHVGWFLIFIIPLFVVMNGAYIIIQNAQRDAIVTGLESNALSEIRGIDLFINTRMEALHNDLFVIKDANETQAYLADQSNTNLNEFEMLLYRISTNQENFIHVKLVNPNGDIFYQLTRSDDTLLVLNDNLGDVTHESYYTSIMNLDMQLIHISKLKMVEDTPILTFILPLIQDDVVISYLIVDYDAESFLSVFSMYSETDIDYLRLGLISSGSVWIADRELNQIQPISDNSLSEEIISDLVENQEAISREFDIRAYQEDYIIDADTYIEIFILYDLNAAMNQSGYYILNHLWVMITINFVLLTFIGVISYMMRANNETKLQLNANSYLTAQNENAVIISDGKLRFTYVNDAFTRIYGYNLDDVFLKNVQFVLQVPQLTPDIDPTQTVDFSGHNWDISKSGIYILKYIRIKEQLAFGKRDKHYIGIFSEPKISFNNYLNYVENIDEEIHDIKLLLNLFEFIVSESTLMMLTINHADSYDFANFLRQKLSPQFEIMIPKLNQIMLYVNVKPDEFNQMIEQIDNLVDFYRFLPETNNEFTYTLSLAQANDDVDHLTSLIDALIITMSCLDHHKHTRHHFYHPDMKMNIKRRHQIYKALDDGFQNNEFYVNYQIQKNLENDHFEGAEALLRWHNDTLGQIYPDEFIPIIESSFYINHLSLMVLNLVIHDIKPYLALLPENFRISINLSGFDFGNDYVISQLIKVIEESQIPSSTFTFEILESIYIDHIERTNKIINMLHQYDIKIAIDDFGTGYSSISSLKSIEVDYVKIDKQFMMGYPDKDDGLTLQRMISIIHDMHKPVVVEGTETQEQIDYCKKHHVTYIQGYVISKPKAIDDMMEEFFNIPKKKD